MADFLERILQDVREELEEMRSARPESELRRRLEDAAPCRDFAGALSAGFGLIAEMKERSPSVGAMRRENVETAVDCYESSGIVRALSVLTNRRHFGMSMEKLEDIRARVSKPVLRKDFILEEYQILEARAFGADAILLMANVLPPFRIAEFARAAADLGMASLVEVHTTEEIRGLPEGLGIIGINSRRFRSSEGFDGGEKKDDFSVHLDVFDLVELVPAPAIKVAESGLNPENIALARTRFDAALVGTSLLRSEKGVAGELRRFEEALSQ